MRDPLACAPNRYVVFVTRVLVLAPVFALILAACGDSGGDGTSTSTPALTPQVDATAAPTSDLPPTPTVRAGVNELRSAGDARIPDGVALLIETGCWQCDGGPTGLQRVYRDASGSTVRQELLAGLPGSLISIEVAARSKSIVVTMCTRAQCGNGFVEADADSERTVFWSRDGGDTWATVATLGLGDGAVIAATAGGPVLSKADGSLTLLPGDAAVRAPSARDRRWIPQPVSADELGWISYDTFEAFRADGSPVFDIPGSERMLAFTPAGPRVRAVRNAPVEDTYAAYWLEPRTAPWRGYVGLIGAGAGVFREYASESIVVLGPMLTPTTGTANATLPDNAFSPIIINYEDGTYSALREDFKQAQPGRNFVRGVQQAP